MSIDSMISSYGRTLTKVRPVWIRDAVGGGRTSTTTGTATAAITGFLQIGQGAIGLRYGRENVRHGATLYTLGSVDILPHDRLTVTIAGEVRTYRVDSVRIPDDRATSDHMCHKIATLEEDLPRG